MIDNTYVTRLGQLLDRCGHNSHTHLYYLGDKQWFWDAAHQAVLAYRTVGKWHVVLGDPVGDPEAVEPLIEQFVASCRKQRRIPVFYQTSSSFLPLYRRLGLCCTKIGEEALVDLPSFSLQGKSWLKLRGRLNKFQREGYSFQVLYPPYSESILKSLHEISKEWLNDRKEKSFSVGSFGFHYISRFPVAVLTDRHGEHVAFASIAGDLSPEPETTDASTEPLPLRRITVDLMRYKNTSPLGTMDVLFASLFLWAKQQSYDICSLGMAPLANVEDSFVARLIYKYGNKLYNFKGLYGYKNKFEPIWKDVYLVYPPATVLVSVALIMLIIHSPRDDQMTADPLFSQLQKNG